jgi:hypothetical protein
MTVFTIETAYSIPVWRRGTYEAATVEDACRLAVADNDWSGAKEDHETSGETYVSGIWLERESAHQAPLLPIPSQFDETMRRKCDHFETLLGTLKMLAQPPSDPPPDLTFWQPRATAAIAKAEAILAGAPDPA